MAYTVQNFKTKKALKDALATGKRLSYYEPGGFAAAPENGIVYLEGPHYPEPHKWYATAKVENGYIVSVK